VEKTVIKRKQFRRRLKRRAAALAVGAAIMTGAFSGAPITKVQAAEAPSNVSLAKAPQTTQDSRPPGYGWHQHKYGWPSPDENQAWYQDGKIFYRSTSNEAAYNAYDPVDFVKSTASAYGFDANLDDFSLLTVTSRSALVEVRQHDTGKVYNVLLKRTHHHDWTIVDVHAI
jgi:hypothetical protein